MQALLAAILLTFLVSSIAWGEPPSRPLSSFDRAKQVARNAIYAGHDEEFYCGCRWIPEPPTPSASGGRIDASSCGYKPRKDPNRGARLEWEHVVPAKFFGQHIACWRKGHEACVKKDGKPYKGRNCCSKVDTTFRRIEADLHNLTPSVGEINGDRSDLPYGIVEGELREYGQCDFEIGGKPRVAEPRDTVRGDAARIWLYMSETYKIKLSAETRAMYESWSQADPPDEWERLRDLRIENAQGNKNRFVGR